MGLRQMSKKNQERVFEPFFPLRGFGPVQQHLGPSAKGDFPHASPSVGGSYAAPETAALDRANFEQQLIIVEQSMRRYVEETYPTPVLSEVRAKLASGIKPTPSDRDRLLAELNQRDERLINLEAILDQIRWVRAYFERTTDPTGYFLVMNLAAMLVEAYQRYDVAGAHGRKAGQASGEKRRSTRHRTRALRKTLELAKRSPHTGSRLVKWIADELPKLGIQNANSAPYSERTIARWLQEYSK
jgi:hypothetical protein